MSSATMTSAREPASWPVMPTDFTDGEWSGLAGPTSNATFEDRWSSRGRRKCISSMSLMSRSVNVEKSSARCFDAETTMILSCGLQ
jgi:hypothetical protein